MGRTRGSKPQFEETGGDSKRRGRRPNRTVREGLDARCDAIGATAAGREFDACAINVRLGSLGLVYEAALLRR